MMLGGDCGGTVLLQPVDAAYDAAFPRQLPGCTVLRVLRRPVHTGAAFMQPPPPAPPLPPTCPREQQHPLFPTAAVQHHALQLLLQQLSPTALMAAIRAADQQDQLQQQSPTALMAAIRAADQQDQRRQKAVEVRDVWSWNLGQELRNIGGLLPSYPGVCIDTEFPGTVLDTGTPRHLRAPRESYAVVKSNVDGLKLLQLGLALFDPVSGGRCPVVWQFNFRGFDEARDPHSPISIAMLKAHGMDFPELHDHGIDTRVFALEFARSALARRTGPTAPQLTWAAFSGSYDFAYLAKVLGGGRPLPETLEGFLAQLHAMFGPWVLDVKYIARLCGGGGGGIRGGLEHVAAVLGVERSAGRAHNAGSDSLLAADVLQAMVARFLGRGGEYAHAGKIDSLAVL